MLMTKQKTQLVEINKNIQIENEKKYSLCHNFFGEVDGNGEII